METDGYLSAEDFRSEEVVDGGKGLDERSKSNFKYMIGDSSLSTKPVFSVKIYWERTGLKQIFDRKQEQLIPIPTIKPVDIPDSISTELPANPLPSDKTRRGFYSEVINFKCNMPGKDVEENSMRKALEVCYLISACGSKS